MLNRLRSPLMFIIGSLLVVCLLVADADAQSRKKRRARRVKKPVAAPVITNPTIAPPTTAANTSSGDIKVISTADQNASDPESNLDTLQTQKPKTSSSAAQDDMQQTINSLSNQVNRLNDRLSKMQEDDRYLMDMERLTRSEQRAEQLRAQLIDTQSKMADLQSRLDQIDYMLKPENIDKSTQLYGSVHPEEAREARRKQLENEKARVQAQLDILEKSRSRLESAITTADSEVDMLRARLNQQRDQQSSSPSTETRPRKPDQ